MTSPLRAAVERGIAFFDTAEVYGKISQWMRKISMLDMQVFTCINSLHGLGQFARVSPRG